MSTTTLLIDFLVIGVQAALWLTMLVLTLLGFQPVATVSIKGYEAIAGVIALAVVYPLGIIVDHVADALLRRLAGARVRKAVLGDSDENVMGITYKANDPTLAAYFSYLRMRIRVSRSSVLNFFLIGATFVALVLVRLDGVVPGPAWPVAGVGGAVALLAAGFAFAVWLDLTRQFFERQKQMTPLVNRSFERGRGSRGYGPGTLPDPAADDPLPTLPANDPDT